MSALSLFMVSAKGVTRSLAATAEPQLLIAPCDPFAREKILPTTPDSRLARGEVVRVRGTRGEIQSASLVLRSSRDMREVTVTVSDLTSRDGKSIPGHAVDVRIVKCWYQAGEGSIRRSPARVLTPELLLKDDRLVKVDYATKRNYLRLMREGREEYVDISSDAGVELPEDGVFDDANSLLPFDLDAGSNKQLWLTATIPDTAGTGTYRGRISVAEAGKSLGSIAVEITVFPFTLAESALEYAIYYRGLVTGRKYPPVGSEHKSESQYRLELADMAGHGILASTIFQRIDDRRLERALEIRNEFSFSHNHLYTLGTTTGNSTDQRGLQVLAARVSHWKTLAASYGYKTVFIYGVDEAVGAGLAAQRASWDVVHREGAGMFVALYEGAVEQAGDFIDVAILSGFKPAETAKWHQRGKRVLCYGNPQVGVEDPSIYRRNYGLLLWDAGYDGCMPYAYQHGFGNIWNDFDHKEFRDHVFAYPTMNGLVGTVQWEGFRAAVNDVRYLSTLLALDGGDGEALKKSIHARLADARLSLDDTRDWLTKRILAHTNTGKKAAP